MGNKGTLKSMSGTGTAKRTIDRRVAALEEQVVYLEQKIASVFATVKELVTASNNSTLVVSCVERFLDERFGEDWDSGLRKEAEARAELLKRRKELILRSQAQRGTLKTEERRTIALEIWGIARALEVRGDDVAVVVSLHLQNGDVESSLDVVEEVRTGGVKISAEVAGLFDKLVERCVEVAREAGNELLVQRALRIRKIEPR